MAMNDMAKLMMERLTRKFDNQKDCDVVFEVQGQIIGAHKVVLDIGSEMLDEMVSGWTSDKQPISIDTLDYESFEKLLRYMYSGELSISKGNVFTFLYAAANFKISYLEEHCVDLINESIGIENCCSYMNEAFNFKSTVLQQKCLDTFSRKTGLIIADSSFGQLSQPALSALLDTEETNVVEIELFRRIKRWMEQKCKDENLPVNGPNMRQVIGDALFKIRFPTMTAQDFGNTVTTIIGLLTNDEIAQVFRKITVLDSADIACPFSDIFRCRRSYYRLPCSDMSNLCDQQVLYEVSSGQQCNFSLLLKAIKDFCKNEDMGLSVVSLRLVLQCFADLTNSTAIITQATDDNQNTRNELYEEFQTWLGVSKKKNVTETMANYKNLRTKLSKLCSWTY